MVPGKLAVPGRRTIWIRVGQGPTALSVIAGGVCLDIFTLDYPFSPLSPSFWETEILSQRAVKPKNNQPIYCVRSRCGWGFVWTFLFSSILSLLCLPLSERRPEVRGGRVVRWCWINFQCRGVLQFWGVVGWCDGAG